MAAHVDERELPLGKRIFEAFAPPLVFWGLIILFAHLTSGC